jgi:DNA-binding PadR family transcriptional regulator
MELHDICDQILFFVDKQPKHGFHAEQHVFEQIFPNKEAELSDIYVALIHLTETTPKYLWHIDQRTSYKITPEGQKFVKEGGYAGQRKREQIEQLTNEQDRQLMRLVNQSLLDTNKSIVETNDSVQATNQSVIDTNESVKQVGYQTISIYKFQKTTTWLTIFVAVTAVIIALLSYKNDYSKDYLLKLLEEERMQKKQLQKKIDSLIIIPASVSFHDTLPIKLP